jgi:hypothetical protein
MQDAGGDFIKDGIVEIKDKTSGLDDALKDVTDTVKDINAGVKDGVDTLKDFNENKEWNSQDGP